LLPKDISTAPLFIISVLVNKTHDRKGKIFIRSFITLIRIAIITYRFHIINIRIDIITVCICIFSIRFDKYSLCTDKDSPRSKSGTYAKHTKANVKHCSQHHSPALAGIAVEIFLCHRSNYSYNQFSMAQKIVTESPYCCWVFN